MNVPNRKPKILATALSALVAVTGAHAAPAARHPVPPAAAPAETTQAKDRIDYENLHGYLGDRITVHTTYHTTRTGTLARFSKTELTLAIDTPGGPTELTIPKNTILDMVAAPGPSPAQH